VGFVAGDAIDFSGVRDDFVDGQAEMRGQQNEILEPTLHRLRRRVLDGFSRDALGLSGHVGLQEELVAGGAKLPEASCLDLAAGTGASCTSRFFAIALARATSVAMPVTRLISSGLTNGLLAKPHTPLWITRTPNPYVSVASPPPKPPPPRRICPLRTAIDCTRL